METMKNEKRFVVYNEWGVSRARVQAVERGLRRPHQAIDKWSKSDRLIATFEDSQDCADFVDMKNENEATVPRSAYSRIGEDICVECLHDTSFGSGKFIDRIPVFDDDQDPTKVKGHLCIECQDWSQNPEGVGSA